MTSLSRRTMLTAVAVLAIAHAAAFADTVYFTEQNSGNVYKAVFGADFTNNVVTSLVATLPGQATGLAFGPDGSLYVNETNGPDAIFKVDTSTGHIQQFTPGGSFGYAGGLAFDSQGNLYDLTSAGLYGYGKSGNVIASYSQTYPYSIGQGAGLTISGNTIYLADQWENCGYYGCNPQASIATAPIIGSNQPLSISLDFYGGCYPYGVTVANSQLWLPCGNQIQQTSLAGGAAQYTNVYANGQGFSIIAGTDGAFYWVGNGGVTRLEQPVGAPTNAYYGNAEAQAPYQTGAAMYAALQPASSVPEPTSLLLFGTGLTGLATLLRRRKH